MTQVNVELSTGLAGLDRVLRGLIPGDNIVWQVDSMRDYLPFVEPYCRAAAGQGRRVVYFRFARHEPVLADQPGVQIVALNPAEGFETFVTQIHQTIARTGRGGFYVFDCLSDLSVDWYSDQMLGNFFLLTCPYLFDMETIAYFALLRDHHAEQATSAIAETAQVLLNVYRHRERLYVHPLKVQQRHSQTMYMLHEWQDGQFRPVTASAIISEIMHSVPLHRLELSPRRLGVWNRVLRRAEDVLEGARRGWEDAEESAGLFRRLLRMLVSRDERVLRLAEKHLSLSDVVEIGKRMIGTGLIGGKSVGMLLGRAILRRSDPRWSELLESHDSFFVGSDVFYTFLVRNGIWWVRQKQRDPDTFLEGAESARQRLLTGTFPDDILRQFEYMLDYFGQSPIIVRSSSLLEDNFGNAFAGKYESVFCANQGPRHKRLEDFLSAVRTIYASTMSVKALTYRAQRGMLQRDEQMAILVQRVSGGLYGALYYPQVAGVGMSYNPYVWSEHIDPQAGALRLVFGLGTRAVDRADDDYTRLVALNDPARRPEANFDKVRRYAQRKVDVLDLEANQLVSHGFEHVARNSPGMPLERFASRDPEAERRLVERNQAGGFPWVLTFDQLLSQTEFVPDVRQMLRLLQEAYEYPVDVEITANFASEGAYKINLVQCRPLQVKEGGTIVEPPGTVPPEDVILEAHGAVIGRGRLCGLDRLVYVVPSVYGELPVRDRYEVARLIGRVLHPPGGGRAGNVMLLGPGRWGTTTPSLGVPVAFADINTVSVLCEIVAMRDDFVPDVSLGTHFFNELVELDILYLALFPNRQDNRLNRPFLEGGRNRLCDLLPDAAQWANAVRVLDAADLPDGQSLCLVANSLRQKVLCYLERKK